MISGESVTISAIVFKYVRVGTTAHGARIGFPEGLVYAVRIVWRYRSALQRENN